MDQIIQFVTSHWLLCTAFIVVLIALIQVELSGTVSGLKMLESQAVVTMMNREKALILDMRDRAAFQKSHIVGAMHCTLADLDASERKLKKYQNKPIIIVCGSGSQSPKLARALKAKQFTELYGLKGGISAWQTDNLPLTHQKG